MFSQRSIRLMVLGFFALSGSGCEESTNTTTMAPPGDHGHAHDEHAHGPESLSDALNELTTMRNSVRDAFAKNDPDAAHDPLHEVGHVLEAIPELAKKENAAAENQAAIEKSVNDLMDAFGRVDKTMHGQEGSTYSEESATIDAALEALSQACGLASSKVDASTADAPAADTPGAVEETPAPAADADDSTNDEKPE
ncbi:MAG: hypothetical protein KDB01_10035 [Planctomycetaceae bacterium]|nr:hypothetical protein [Planctomycetaceae bacterium]